MLLTALEICGRSSRSWVHIVAAVFARVGRATPHAMMFGHASASLRFVRVGPTTGKQKRHTVPSGSNYPTTTHLSHLPMPQGKRMRDQRRDS